MARIRNPGYGRNPGHLGSPRIEYSTPKRKRHTKAEWRSVLERFDGRCAYCARSGRMTKDHVLARTAGGGDTIDNIVPACLQCNVTKRSSRSWGRVNGVPRALSFGVPIADAEALIEAQKQAALRRLVEAQTSYSVQLKGHGLLSRDLQEARRAAIDAGATYKEMEAVLEQSAVLRAAAGNVAELPPRKAFRQGPRARREGSRRTSSSAPGSTTGTAPTGRG